MNRMLSAALAVATVASVGSAPAHAMTYTYTADDKALLVTGKGEIQFDEKAIFQKFMASLPKDATSKPTAFMFDSPGGNIYGAYDVAELIREHKSATGVEDNAMCASACVLVWGAGSKKFATTTSHIGVHGIAMDPAATPKDATKEQIDDLAKNKGVYEATGTLQYVQQLAMYGAPDHVVAKAIMTPAADMYWLNADDAKAWGVEVVAPPPKPLGAPTPPVRPTQASANPTQAGAPGLY
jgi:hypothetical protein